MLRIVVLLLAIVTAKTLSATPLSHDFPSIDGGMLDLSDWEGQPVLVVNTASRCGFVDQYTGLQSLYERYQAQGLVVLAVPSDDFRQELSDKDAVKEFCEMTYGIDMPMADISHVKGPKAHPFYREVRAQTGFVPKWNFNKVLIASDGRVAGTWGSSTKPMSRKITKAVEAALAE